MRDNKPNPQAIDSDGNILRARDTIAFSYGIPPVNVKAKVGEINGVLFAFTPEHYPKKIKIAQIERCVGSFYKI